MPDDARKCKQLTERCLSDEAKIRRDRECVRRRDETVPKTGRRAARQTRYSFAPVSFSLGAVFFALPAGLASPSGLASPFAALRFLPFSAGVVSSITTSAASTHSRKATAAESLLRWPSLMMRV